MKNITFVCRTRNYTRSGKHTKTGLIGSLEHSLRVGESITHALNHSPELSDKNQYIFIDKRGNERLFTGMAGLDLMKRYIENISPQVDKKAIESREVIHNQLSAIRTKFRNYKKNNEEEENFFNSLIDASEIQILKEKREFFKTFDTQRKNQKLKQIDKYIELHKNLENAPKQFKVGEHLKTIMQEQIFTIPAKNEVGLNEISVNEYSKFILEYNKKVSPEIDVKSILLHLDENKGNEGDYGIHAHVFVSGRLKNGNMDLINAQKLFAENHCAKYSPELHKSFHDDYKLQAEILHKKLIDDLNKPNANEEYLKHRYSIRLAKLEGQLHGRLFQESFRLVANEWLNQKNLNVEFHYQTRENPDLVKDANKLIKDRIANGMNKEAEVKNAQLKEEMNQKISEIEALNGEINAKVEAIGNLEVERLELEVNNAKLTGIVEKIIQMFEEFIQKKLKKDSNYDADLEINTFSEKLEDTIEEVNGFASSEENQAFAEYITELANQADPNLKESVSKVLREKIKR